MASFSKEMSGLCSTTLKFVTPQLEKYMNPDYKMPSEDVKILCQNMQKIVDLYMNCPVETQRNFRAIADDVDGLNRLLDLIQKAQDQVIRIEMKTTVKDVQKRCAGIRVLLNQSLGKAPKKKPIFLLIVLLILLAVGWFFKGKITSLFGVLKEKTETAVENLSAPKTEGGETSSENPSETGNATDDGENAKDGGNGENEKNGSEDAGSSTDVTEPAGSSDSSSSDAESSENARSEPEVTDQPPKNEVLPTGETTKKRASRTWNDIKGGKLKGRFLYMKNNIVFIEYKDKRNGITNKGFKIENFSKKDQDYIYAELKKLADNPDEK